MTKPCCPVACFIKDRIAKLGISQKDIARKVGFEKSGMINKIKKGHAKLPFKKIGAMAAALETDPVHFFKLCISTYQPQTWMAIEPMMESTLSRDELRLIRSMRIFVGSPYIAALTNEQIEHLNCFLASMKAEAAVIY